MKPAHPQYGQPLLTQAQKHRSAAMDYLEYAVAVLLAGAIVVVPYWMWG